MTPHRRTNAEMRAISLKGLDARYKNLHRDNQLWFRCVYCKHIFDTVKQLSEHEKECPAMATVKQQWASAKTRALRREAR